MTESEKYLLELIRDDSATLGEKVAAVIELHETPNAKDFMLKNAAERKRQTPKLDLMGYYGNIWVRMLHFETSNTFHDGHKHKHDHITFLSSGSILLEIEGHKPKIFTAPTFITVSKDQMHKLTALDDNTTAYCVFALRDENGELTDMFNGDISPYDEVPEDNPKL